MHQTPRRVSVPAPQEFVRLEARAESTPELEVDDLNFDGCLVNITMESKPPFEQDSSTQSDIEASAEDFLAELSRISNLGHLSRTESTSGSSKSEKKDKEQTKSDKGEDSDSSSLRLPYSSINSTPSDWSWTSQYKDLSTPSWDSQFHGSCHSALSISQCSREMPRPEAEKKRKVEGAIEEGSCEHDPESDSWMMCSECCTCGSHTSQLTLSQVVRCFNRHKRRVNGDGEESYDEGVDAANRGLNSKRNGVESSVEVDKGDDEKGSLDEEEFYELVLAASVAIIMIAMLWWVERRGGLL